MLLMIWTKFWRRETRGDRRRFYANIAQAGKVTEVWEGHVKKKSIIMIPFPKGSRAFHKSPRILMAKQILIRHFPQGLHVTASSKDWELVLYPLLMIFKDRYGKYLCKAG